MRRSRRLNQAERWELGLFLGMLTIGCICLAAVFHFQSVPKLFGITLGAPLAAAQPMSVNPPQPATTLFEAAAPRPITQVQRAIPATPVSFLATLPAASSHSKLAKRPTEDIRWYKGEAYKYTRTLKLRVTAYAPDGRCCYPYPGTTTASGLSVKTNHGKLVAADTNLIPMHALVAVPGYSSGAAVPVLDRGGAIKGHRLDVLLPSFDQAKEWGSRLLEVRIYMPVEN